MRNSFALAFANLIVLFSLIFTCGCQNESAATKRVKPARVSYVTPPKARSLSVSEHVALDQTVSEELGPVDSMQVNWEEDTSQKSQKNEKPTLDAILNFESSDFGTLGGDTKKTDAILEKAWK